MISLMNWRMIHLRDVKHAAWRNGGGTTRELLAWPDTQTWRWRVSVAEVLHTGRFSSFVGVQRWFAVLKGDGVCLTVDGRMHMLSKSDQPLAFDGAAQTKCELLGDATQDFNLMVQADLSARMQRVHGDIQMMLSTPKIIAVYAHRARVKVQIGTETQEIPPYSFGWATVAENLAIRVQTSNALLMEIDV
jgi:uncharacterized protein